jgi:hypothetical protein
LSFLDNAGAPDDIPASRDLLARGVFVVERTDLTLPEPRDGLIHPTSWGSLLTVVHEHGGEVVRLTFADIGLQRVRAVEQPIRINLLGDRLFASDHAGGEFTFRTLVAEDSLWIAGRELDFARLLDAIAGG